jgi:hypothetical protein
VLAAVGGQLKRGCKLNEKLLPDVYHFDTMTRAKGINITTTAASRVTIDHEEIRRWAEARNGKPATTIRSENGDGAPICIYFPSDCGQAGIDEISWKSWFKRFETHRLAFVYQEQNAGGEKSNFNQLVGRKTVDDVESAVGGKGRSVSRRRAAGDVPAAPLSAEVGRTRDSASRVGSRMAGKASPEMEEISAITKKQGSRLAARRAAPQTSTSRSKAKAIDGRLSSRSAGK